VEELLAVLRLHRLVAGEHLDVGAETRERCAQLVGGIGDELALPPVGFLECAEHRVEAFGQPAELVLAARLDALREVACLGHALGRSRQSAYGSKGGAGDEQAQRCGHSDSPGGDDDQEQADPIERVVDLAQWARDLDRITAHVRERQHAHVRPVDARVHQEAVAISARHLADAVVDRERSGRPGRTKRLTVFTDELRVAARLSQRRPGTAEDGVDRPM